jgi:hypothetical protein
VLRGLLLYATLSIALVTRAHADAVDNTRHKCLVQGHVYAEAASYRDAGEPLQASLAILRQDHYEEIDDGFLKRAILDIYSNR